MDRRAGRVRRATVRVTPDGRRLAAVLGRLQPLRVRRSAEPDVAGWVEATFRLGAFEGAVLDLCSLGPDIEVLAPEDLRRAVAMRLRAAASRYDADVARQDAEGRAETGTPVTLRSWQ
jgi:predicted DNA-binding transcriptional regulator YafY